MGGSSRRTGFAGLIAAVLVVPSGPAGLHAQAPAYPETPGSSVVDDYHGTSVPDPYRWLEDTWSEETLDWVAAQNAVTFDYLGRLRDRATLERRLTELTDYERFGVPFEEGGLYFFTRNDGLKNQSVYWVQDGPDGEARVLLDPNTLSDEGTVAVAGVAPSPDGRRLAYAIATGGSDWREFKVREIATGRDLDDHVQWGKFTGMSWTDDGAGFLYARYPEPEGENALLGSNTNHQVFYHRLGTPQSGDVRVFAWPEQPNWIVQAEITDDGRYAIAYAGSGSAGGRRVFYKDLGDPVAPRLDAPTRTLIDDEESNFGVIGSDGSVLFAVTDRDAARQRLVAVDLERPAEADWTTIVPESEHLLQSASMVGGRFVTRYLVDAKSEVRIFARDGTELGTIPLPDPIGTVSQISGDDERSEMFLSFQSFLRPAGVYRYDVDTGGLTPFRVPEVAFDPERFETRQLFYTSKDGTRVPMFVTHRKDVALDGSNPTYLYAYGGFNISLTPSFNVSNAMWLEAGGVYAQPNLRGGGEYGEEWHRAGTRERKQNVFDDFIAAAEHLIEEGYTSPEKLSIGGGSNGGLLVGAVMTQRPELFAVAHPAVGVMDMLRYHQFTIGWAWADDYGRSDDPEAFEYLRAYSPLHNLYPATCYPATLVTTADHDDRVVPGHSFKFAATLQAAQGCDNPTLIRIETDAGHGAGTPTSKAIQQAADILAFRAHHLGMVLTIIP